MREPADTHTRHNNTNIHMQTSVCRDKWMHMQGCAQRDTFTNSTVPETLLALLTCRNTAESMFLDKLAIAKKSYHQTMKERMH